MAKVRGPQLLVVMLAAGLVAPVVLLAVLTGRTTRRQIGRVVRVTVRKLADELDQWR